MAQKIKRSWWMYLFFICLGIWCWTGQNWWGVGVQAFLLVFYLWFDNMHHKRMAAWDEYHRATMEAFDRIKEKIEKAKKDKEELEREARQIEDMENEGG